MNARKPLGFEMVNVTEGAVRKTVAQFTCSERWRTLDVTMSSGKPLNAEGLAKTACHKGWVANPFRRTGTYCPTCAGPTTKSKNDPDSELRKVIPMVAATPIKAAPSIVAEVRETTPDERVAIRNHLDKHFDDGVGSYLDGMSDQRVAELVGVPRVAVERLREAAYGPIRVDPAVLEVREAIAAFKGEVEGQQKALDTLKAKALELASTLEKRLAGKAA